MSPTWLYWPLILPPSGTPWAPTDLTGLQCWLDASDSSTITESGGSISEWADKHGSNDADDAVNASNVKITTRRPTVATAAQNGLDAINFNGSQHFDHNTARGMLKDRSCALMAVAMKYGSINNSTAQFAWTNRNTSTGATAAIRFQLLHRGTNAFGAFSRRLDGDSDAFVDTSSTPPFDTNWHIHVAVLDWAADTLSYYIDGSLIGTDSYPSGGANTSNTDHGTAADTWTAIGDARRDGGGAPLSSGSRIGEMICGALSSGSYATSDREKLEGYLAHKWGLEGNLPPDHPYKSAAPTKTLWAPSGLATLRAWYKADAITGLNDGDPVSTWSDSSGNGYDLTQTNNARPLYQTSTLNGLPVIEFDGTDDYLQASTASDWTFLHSDGSTVVAVWKAGTTANPGGGSAYSDGLLTTQTVTGSISGIRGASINYRNNVTAGVTDSVGHFINNGAAGGTWVAINISGSNEHPANAATIVSVTGDPTNWTAANRSRIRVDGGSSIATNTNTNPRSTSSPNIALVLGTVGTSHLEGYIAEVVIFDAILSDADRQRVEGYLAHKWGLQGNLPVDHPHKNSPPEAP